MTLALLRQAISRWTFVTTFASSMAIVIALAGCGTDLPVTSATNALAGGELGLTRAVAVQEHESDRLLAISGVVGTGVGRDASGEAVIVALVERVGMSRLPDRLGGVRVQVEVIGRVEAFALNGRYRPLPIGVSAGNANDCLPGTIGCVLASGNRRYLLSANHVFARQNQAAIGELVLQPSLPDLDPSCGSRPAHAMVARLADFEPVVYDGRTPNRMDAAIAELTTDEFTCATLPTFYGMPSSVPATPTVGAAVLKIGRTTELTRGSIKAVNVKVKVAFPSGTALFVDQILTSKAMGAFGDSGALLVTDDGEHHPLGIIIGGGSTGAAIVNPIGPILERFGAVVCGN